VHRVAIIGCGAVSQGHIHAWKARDDARVVLLADPATELAEERRAQQELDPTTPIVADWREALTADVDLVDICSPSHCHTEQIAAALEAGKHVVTEKPTGYNLEECRFLRYARQRFPEPKVAVAYSLRYYPVNMEIKRLLSLGVIGEVISAHLAWNHPHDFAAPPADPPSMVGRLCDRGGRPIPGSEACGPTHVFDLARYFMGEPREVFAYHGRHGVHALGDFGDDVVASMQAGTVSSLGVRAAAVCVLYGTGGSIHGGLDEHGAYSGIISDQDGPRPIEASPEAGHGDTIRTANIIAAIERDEPLICDLEDGIRTSEMLHALWDSYTLGIRVPVHAAGKTG
jgi:predicted dehydrogenase